MHLIVNNLHIPVEQDGTNAYLLAAADKLGVAKEKVSIYRMLSKALDLKNKEQFHYRISLVARVSDNYENKQKLPLFFEEIPLGKRATKIHERPLIVGFGPAGMFAALELVEQGIKPIILERGKCIEERTKDVLSFINGRRLNAESNVQFGEGGAGSYSDGKLFSRRNNNTSPVNRVLQTFIRFGAPEEIGYIAKPHLGTDVIRTIVRNIRNHILERGGEIHFGAKMTDLLLSGDEAVGVVVNREKEFHSSHIYLALGHSARDTVAMLHEKGVAMEQKPISLGVRIEHSADTINLMRYGDKYKDFPPLGAATYSLNHTNKKIKKGVYTFCMCPGGEIVNASSEEGMLVINGMSYSRRSSPYSNAGLIVSCHPEDYGSSHALGGVLFQKEIERKAFLAGGGNWKAPAQNLMSFLGESQSNDLPDNSYRMGTVPADMQEIFPQFVIKELKVAFKKWKEEVPLFVSGEAVLLAAETRTSSTVRFIRNERFESVSTKNLYILGEGSGHTGGITSSAADAVKAIKALGLSGDS